MSKYFFERGNARVSWDNAPEWAEWFTVDYGGRGYWFKKKPDIGGWCWLVDCVLELACAVGCPCNDWETLLFQREKRRTLISAEEWQHIRFCFPWARYAAKDMDGEVCVYKKAPTQASKMWRGDEFLRVAPLEERFASVDWAESLVKCPGLDSKENNNEN